MNTHADMKIFIVDDDPFCRMMYYQHLLNMGFRNITLFSNGPECIDSLHEQPQVVFLDYDMKPLNGLDTLKMIRQFDSHVYPVMLSAQKDIRVAISALKHGAFDYISKGNDDLVLISKVMHNITRSLTKEEALVWA